MTVSYRFGPMFMWAVPPSRDGKTARQWRAARRRYARDVRRFSRWNAAQRR